MRYKHTRPLLEPTNSRNVEDSCSKSSCLTLIYEVIIIVEQEKGMWCIIIDQTISKDDKLLETREEAKAGLSEMIALNGK